MAIYSKADIEKINLLINSGDKANLQLATQLVIGRGWSDQLLTEIFWLYQHLRGSAEFEQFKLGLQSMVSLMTWELLDSFSDFSHETQNLDKLATLVDYDLLDGEKIAQYLAPENNVYSSVFALCYGNYKTQAEMLVKLKARNKKAIAIRFAIYRLPEIILKDQSIVEITVSFKAGRYLNPDIWLLKRLKKLNLQNGELHNFPAPKEPTKLVKLNLSNNKLKDLPDCFDKFPDLQEFDLSFNSISDLPPTIQQLQKLISFRYPPELSYWLLLGLPQLKKFNAIRSTKCTSLATANSMEAVFFAARHLGPARQSNLCWLWAKYRKRSNVNISLSELMEILTFENSRLRQQALRYIVERDLDLPPAFVFSKPIEDIDFILRIYFGNFDQNYLKIAVWIAALQPEASQRKWINELLILHLLIEEKKLHKQSLEILKSISSPTLQKWLRKGRRLLLATNPKEKVFRLNQSIEKVLAFADLDQNKLVNYIYLFYTTQRSQGIYNLDNRIFPAAFFIRFASVKIQSASKKRILVSGRLYLYGMRLKEIPKLFFKSKAREAWLNGNQLQNIPVELLEQWKNIQKLYLGVNHLQDLPDEFGKLKKIRILHLQNNRLTKLPQSFGQLQSLEILDLSFNRFQHFPKVLLQLPKLKILKIRTSKRTPQLIITDLEKSALPNDCQLIY